MELCLQIEHQYACHSVWLVHVHGPIANNFGTLPMFR